MDERFLLMIPGPTFSEQSVLLSLARVTRSHVSVEFEDILRESLEMLKKILNTDGEVIIMPGSGTLAMEFSIANFVEPGSRVLNLVSGYFGEYFIQATRARGGVSVEIKSQLGRGFRGDGIRELVEKEKTEVLTVQHVETSTGVVNYIKEIGEELKDSDTVYIVDAVASLGGMEINMREWGIDVVFTGSQKALAVPPGLAIVGLSKRAVELIEGKKKDLFFFDGRKWLAMMRSVRNYFSTMPVNMIYALNESLKKILSEGLENRYLRHKVIAEAIRGGLEAMGLNIVAEREFRSDTVTAVWLPDKIKFQDLSNEMAKRNIVIAGGLSELAGKIFRIGHMGVVNPNDAISTIAALERSLHKLNYPVKLGSGVEATQQVLSKYNF
ncbi:MAG: alanine--glyoxylate aminotransferase family protein [Zestosphaera sp.]